MGIQVDIGRRYIDDSRCFSRRNTLNSWIALLEGRVLKHYRYARPTVLLVEPTTYCNLRCLMCGRTYAKIDHRHMPLEILERILDEAWSLREVSLVGSVGEPLLNPEIAEMIALVKGRGLKLGFVTNAVALDASLAGEIVRAKMDWIGISFDAASKETYERIRVGARYESVLKNIEGLIERRNRSGDAKPFISIAVVAMRWNIAEIPGVVDLFGKMGADQVAIQNFGFETGAIRDVFGNDSPMLTREDSPEAIRVLERCREVAGRVGIRLTVPPLESQWGGGDRANRYRRFCVLPWTTLYVTIDGFITPCCCRPDASRFAFGNIIEEDFDKIWRLQKYRQFRKRCMTLEPPATCRGCTMNQPL